MKPVNRALLAAGALTGLASLLHVAIILGGPGWYRLFGAGEGMAQLAERGSAYPAAVTAAIALLLASWALYAFSGAGVIRRFPLLRLALVLITAVFLLRGLIGIPAVTLLDGAYMNELRNRMVFMVVSSLVCLALGVLYALGTVQVWSSQRNSP